MTDREEREKVIAVLLDMYKWLEEVRFIVSTRERIHAIAYAIASIKTDLRYDLLYEETSGQADKPTTKNNLGVDKPTIIDWNNCHTPEQLDSIATTKNDLGVDWENYKDVDGNSLDDLILEVLQNNFDCGNTYGYKVADEIIGLLPSVPPQELRWIPCSEELPKKTGWYLITFKTYDGEYAVSEMCYRKPENYWTDKDISKKVFDNDEVVAWMPLSKPYEPQESEDNE